LSLRCPDNGASWSSARSDNVNGPCHLEGVIGDNVCSDNLHKSGNMLRVQFSENLPELDATEYLRRVKTLAAPR
jgi:hypothetical protein